jgi:hypothetical protein
MSSSSSNVVGVHYRVGKKIGEGSFGVIFEGTNLLNNQQVAIKFVWRLPFLLSCASFLMIYPRNHAKATHHNYEMNTEHTRFSLAAVSTYSFIPSYTLRFASLWIEFRDIEMLKISLRHWLMPITG